jgi:hypothetical protein
MKQERLSRRRIIQPDSETHLLCSESHYQCGESHYQCGETHAPIPLGKSHNFARVSLTTIVVRLTAIHRHPCK